MIFYHSILFSIITRFNKTLCCLIALFFFSFSSNAQNDSIEVESLYGLGVKEKYTNLKNSKLSFEKAVNIINERILSKEVKSPYFLLKKALILDELGYNYRKQTNYTLSLKTVQESLKIKKTIGETFTLSRSYRNLGRIYHHYKDSTKAFQFYTKALSLAKKHNNEEEIVNTLNAFAVYYTNKDLEQTKKYAITAYEYADSIKFQRGKSLALANLSGYERRKKNYTEALTYSKQDLEISATINDKTGMERSYKALGYAYRKLKQPKKALFYYEKSLELVVEMELENLLANRYLSISNAYTDLKQHEVAFSYYRLYKRQQIKDLNVKSIKEFAQLDAKYSYEKQKTIDSLQIVEKQKIKEAKIKEEASVRFWKFTTIIAIIFGLVFTTVLFILRRRKEQIKLEKLQNEILQNEINYKKKDLKHLALDITNNKEWALVLAEKLESVKSSTGRKRASELDNLETEIKNKIKVNESTESFHNQIDILSSSFYEKLKSDFSNLTKNDIRLCSLIRLNMDTKQIATLQNINPASVKMNRNRLRKKLNLTANDDLHEFLNSY
jgi:tetratricopeptide (TPR) repeat protein